MRSLTPEALAIFKSAGGFSYEDLIKAFQLELPLKPASLGTTISGKDVRFGNFKDFDHFKAKHQGWSQQDHLDAGEHHTDEAWRQHDHLIAAGLGQHGLGGASQHPSIRHHRVMANLHSAMRSFTEHSQSSERHRRLMAPGAVQGGEWSYPSDVAHHEYHAKEDHALARYHFNEAHGTGSGFGTAHALAADAAGRKGVHGFPSNPNHPEHPPSSTPRTDAPWEHTKDSFLVGRASMGSMGRPSVLAKETDPSKVGLHADVSDDYDGGRTHNVVYRDAHGVPLAYGEMFTHPGKGRDDHGIASMGRDKERGLASAIAIGHIGKYAHSLGAARPVGDYSIDTARLFHHFSTHERAQSHGDVPEHVLKDYPRAARAQREFHGAQAPKGRKYTQMDLKLASLRLLTRQDFARLTG